ncbi:hypothetical protein CEXT_28241 [Caerostris extrusa]|uniref:Uncharacterized protein n=1 Tax=Caerostris extrusa TaxID=172846 RepID=A0AAV4TUB7_CAEEX|nr:hypothetical protein CEXT_28241 [Caerostris extrusa]
MGRFLGRVQCRTPSLEDLMDGGRTGLCLGPGGPFLIHNRRNKHRLQLVTRHKGTDTPLIGLSNVQHDRKGCVGKNYRCACCCPQAGNCHSREIVC